MAVHIEESDTSADTLKRKPGLRSIKGGKAESKGVRSTAGEPVGVKSRADDSRTYPKLRAARQQTKTRARTGAVRLGRQASRGAARQASRGTASIGSIFVLLTGAGIMFAIIRNPRLITAPLGFVTSVFSRFTSLFGSAAARNVA